MNGTIGSLCFGLWFADTKNKKRVLNNKAITIFPKVSKSLEYTAFISDIVIYFYILSNSETYELYYSIINNLNNFPIKSPLFIYIISPHFFFYSTL